jgi:transposase
METKTGLDEKQLNATDENLETLQNKCAIQEQKIEELAAKVKWYEEQFRLGQQKRFGASSEKTDAEQLTIFNEAEQEADAKAAEPSVEEITYKRKKQKGKNDKMLEDLPVEVVEYRLSETEQVCPECDSPLHEMSREVRKELKIIPAQVKVVEHVRFVYACRSCEQNAIKTPIITAPMPAPVLPKSLVSPSLMAFIMNRKYAEAIPLYRQEQQFKNFGIELSRQNMANWMIRGSGDWLSHLYERMRQRLVQSEVLHADETTLQVLHEDGRAATSKSYMWLFATGRLDVPIYLYEYQTTRASKHPQKFLRNFKGYVHSDGYAGYNDIPNVKTVGCWAHARRKFDEALKAMPEGADTLATPAMEGLNFCNKLFAIEKTLAEETVQNRYQMRQEQQRPVLDAFLAWLQAKKKQVLPKSKFGEAITYCLNQWKKLEAFMLDGRLEISNNRGERAIKPFVIGRKNFLFSNTPKGATASAVIYSVIETAKANGLSPFHYLTWLFEKLPNIDLNDMTQLDELLPWSEALPDVCRVPIKK